LHPFYLSFDENTADRVKKEGGETPAPPDKDMKECVPSIPGYGRRFSRLRRILPGLALSMTFISSWAESF